MKSYVSVPKSVRASTWLTDTDVNPVSSSSSRLGVPISPPSTVTWFEMSSKPRPTVRPTSRFFWSSSFDSDTPKKRDT